VDHGPAQVLGIGFAARVAGGDLVGHAVIADQAGVIDREVGGALLEVADGIAARLHHFSEEFIGPPDRSAGVVDELALDLHPAVRKALDFAAVERAYAERFDPLLALPQFSLGFAAVAGLVDGGDILRAVFRAHLFGAAALRVDHRADDH